MLPLYPAELINISNSRQSPNVIKPMKHGRRLYLMIIYINHRGREEQKLHYWKVFHAFVASSMNSPVRLSKEKY
jgi:hypothetical protein